MEPWEILNRILEKSARSGAGGLSSHERIVHRANRFAVDLETAGLSGFLYNVSPSVPNPTVWSELRAVAEAVRAIGDPASAGVLEDAATLLEGLPESRGTWSTFIEPAVRELSALESRLSKEADILWDKLEAFAASERVSGEA